MMVLGISVTSTPNASLVGAGVAALGAGAGGGASGVGLDACAKAGEATPSANTAARVVARQREVIEISMNRRAPGSAREESLKSSMPARGRNNRKTCLFRAGPGHHLGISH